MTNDTAYILLAHGSSDANWQRTFEMMCAGALLAGDNVYLSYMELGTPLLGEQIASLSKTGTKNFHVIPLFLAAGKHLRQDIPEILGQLSAKLNITVTQHPPIGENPKLAQAITSIVDTLINAPDSL